MIDFKNDPDILSNMRICLEGIARIKGVKLQHPLEKYDMDVMLNMMKEMETLPVKRSFNGAPRFKDDNPNKRFKDDNPNKTFKREM